MIECSDRFSYFCVRALKGLEERTENGVDHREDVLRGNSIRDLQCAKRCLSYVANNEGKKVQSTIVLDPKIKRSNRVKRRGK